MKKRTPKEKKENSSEVTSLLLDNSPQASDDYIREADILRSKIAESGVKNIAVVASFGAGKSSAIETYLLKHRDEYKRSYSDKKPSEIFEQCNSDGVYSKHTSDETYTKVSLASFNDTEYNDGDIERSILIQLFRSANKSKLPHSTIERTSKKSRCKSFLMSIIITLFFASGVSFGLSFGILDIPKLWILRVKLAGIMFITFCYLVYYIIHYNKFSKIKYKDFELEIKKNDSGVVSTSGQSLINKFIDEVLYFFQSTKIDLVLFEDLDRLADKESSSIFVKLRELNTIINNSVLNKKVTFLYAVKDDMIKDQEQRSKFFEFILPIIPIINPLTTTNKIFDIQSEIVLKRKNLELDSEFIHTISSIKELNMRIIKNVYNDYIVAYDRIFLDSVENRLQNEKLFAMCLYKNLYPEYYAQLESRNEGFIPIITDKKHLSKNAIEKSNKEIVELEQKIQESEKCHNQSFEELKLILKGQALDKLNIQLKYTDNKNVQLNINQLDTFKDVNFNSIRLNGYYNNQSIFASNIQLPNGETYFEREQAINNKSIKEREKLTKQITEQKEIIQKYETMTFNQLVAECGIDMCFENIEAKYNAQRGDVQQYKGKPLDMEINNAHKRHMELLRFFVENDYLDENYIEYTSSYKSKLLSSSDEEFRQKVLRGERDFGHKLDSVENVSNMLRTSAFSKTSILNNSILLDLDVVKSKNIEGYKNLLNLLYKNDSYVKKIIIEFVQSNKEENVLAFLQRIYSSSSLIIFNTIFCTSTIAKEKKDLALSVLIENYYCSGLLNENNEIWDYVSNHNDYLNTFRDLDFDKLQNFLLELKPSFSEIKDNTNDITKFIVENGLYKITIKNLEIALNARSNNVGQDFYCKNYEFLSRNSKVKEHIDNNIQDYIANIFLSNLMPNEEENFNTILGFLQDEQNIDIGYRVQIIEKYNFFIDDLDKFDKILYSKLFECDRVNFCWSNIILGYENGIDFSNGLKEWLSRNVDKIDIYEYKEETVERCSKILMEALQTDFNTDIFILQKLLKKITFKYNSCEKFSIDANLKVLIDENKVNYNKEELKFLHDKPKSLIAYVVEYENEINNEFDKFFANISSQGLGTIILNNDISSNIKQKLLNLYDERIIVSGFEKDFCDIILKDKLSISTKMLAKFRDSNLSQSEKESLALLVTDRENELSIPVYTDFVRSILPYINKTDKSEIKLKDTTKNTRELIKWLEDHSNIKATKHKDGAITLKKKKDS